jgi:hypothetical protein
MAVRDATIQIQFAGTDRLGYVGGGNKKGTPRVQYVCFL